MSREELGSGWGSALEEGSSLPSAWALILHRTFGSQREEDTQSEVLPSTRILEPPGLDGEGEAFPEASAPRHLRNPVLGPDQGSPHLLNRPEAPILLRLTSLPLGCALPLPESPQGERGKKGREKRH